MAFDAHEGQVVAGSKRGRDRGAVAINTPPIQRTPINEMEMHDVNGSDR